MAVILVAPDLLTGGSPAAAHWVLATCRSLRALGHDVLFHPRERELGHLGRLLTQAGVQVLPYDATNPEHQDERGHLPRYRARRVLAEARQRKVDIVLAQGGELTLALAGGRALADRLWGLPIDTPYRIEELSPLIARRLSSLVRGTRRLLVLSEDQRALIEAEHVEALARLTLMPTPHASGPTAERPTPTGDTIDIEVCLDFFTEESAPDLAAHAHVMQERRHVPRTVLTGAVDAPMSSDARWREVPGLVMALGGAPSTAPAGLVPAPADPVAHSQAVDYLLSRGALPILIDPTPSSHVDPRVIVLPSAAGLADLPQMLRSARPMHVAPSAHPVGMPESTSQWFRALPTHVPLRHEEGRPLRVVIAGADLKFAGDLVLALEGHPDVDLRIDLFKANATPQPEISQDYVAWADVVIAEFASKNALWYAEHVRPHQRLIVHLHGYELLSDWIDDLRIDHCAAIVVASDFYRRRALDMKGWPSQLVRVVPNSVDAVDLQREKFDDARFHLGMAGYVPILKRPDRALHLLSLLRQKDERYVLHLRGHHPWNYQYEWKKSAHQDSYRRFFREAGEDPVVMDGLCFEPFGPDMGNWLRRVGWILSPSTRETFHLAGVEGAASGAVPLVWEREGSREIFSDRWNFSDTEAVADFVLETNRSFDAYAEESRRAQEFSHRYTTETVTEAWFRLISELRGSPDAVRPFEVDVAPQEDLPPEAAAIASDVEGALLEGSYGRALEVLDERIAITAKSTGAIKDIELWVRGVAALDARRFSLYLPRTESGFDAAGPGLRVRCTGVADNRGVDDSTATVVSVDPYPFTEPKEAARLSDGQPQARIAESAAPAHLVRADRWLELHSARVLDEALERGARRLEVSGSWWLALLTALAADRLRLPAEWTVTDPEDVARAQRALADPYTADHVDYLALRAFEGMNRIYDQTGHVNGPLAAHVRLAQPDAGPESSDRALPARPAPYPDYEGIPSAMERTLSTITVLVAGDDELVESWRRTGVRVEALQPTRLPAVVGAEVDLVVVDPQLVDDPTWQPQLTTAAPGGQTGMSRLFDRVRTAGGRSLVLGHAGRAWPPGLTATLRKADRLTVSAPDQAASVLTLNPVSVERVLPTREEGPWESAPAVFLRWTGIPVRAD